MPPTLLVTGATGRQGGAVLRHLRGAPFGLRALSRDPSRPAGAALRAAGVEVVAGDLDDEASLRRACEGVSAVFSVQDPWANGVPREIEQGERIAAVARAAGVQHLVYASVAAADQPTGVPHFESKGRIEKAIRASGLCWTFLRPVFFMDMLVPWREPNAAAMWGALFRGGTSVQAVSTDDIGAVAARALQAPDTFASQIVELAADELHLEPARAAYTSVIGRRPSRLVIPFFLMRLINKEAAINFEWIRDAGWKVDIAACHARFPGLMRWEAWLKHAREAREGR